MEFEIDLKNEKNNHELHEEREYLSHLISYLDYLTESLSNQKLKDQVNEDFEIPHAQIEVEIDDTNFNIKLCKERINKILYDAASIYYP
ncbi:hypothetical protein [Fluviispira sanaruensis]|uniref:Uncharacterized protein n=1 Tax=Fluviispira sanaruensis TaxID=2493639 RepID=A0A4V0P2W7_FLUSA|nr:hypothetical protein [Fluviispira sanaruensis]BBH54667.1 hypothetical protein JCM31447_31410 [Fluviispira sanaruensis]